MGQTEIKALMAMGLPSQTASVIDQYYSTGIASSQIPATTNTVDLGSSTNVFRNLFLGTALSLPVETVAGAGTNQGTAAALSATKVVHQITGANGTVGWILPATTRVGTIHILLNTTAGVALIYPATGGTMNGGSANAAFTALTGIKPIIAIATGTDTWLIS